MPACPSVALPQASTDTARNWQQARVPIQKELPGPGAGGTAANHNGCSVCSKHSLWGEVTSELQQQLPHVPDAQNFSSRCHYCQSERVGGS